jgi:acetoin utilization protein AcuB
MKSAAVMTRDVVVVAPIVTVGGAAAVMARRGIRHVPIVEGGRLLGILSDRDVLKHDRRVTCAEAMTPAPVTCTQDATVSHLAQLMLDHKIDSIPIVGPNGALVGLVTSSDLLSLLVERAEVRRLPFDFKLRLASSDGEAFEAAA